MKNLETIIKESITIFVFFPPHLNELLLSLSGWFSLRCSSVISVEQTQHSQTKKQKKKTLWLYFNDDFAVCFCRHKNKRFVMQDAWKKKKENYKPFRYLKTEAALNCNELFDFLAVVRIRYVRIRKKRKRLQFVDLTIRNRIFVCVCVD